MNKGSSESPLIYLFRGTYPGKHGATIGSKTHRNLQQGIGESNMPCLFQDLFAFVRGRQHLSARQGKEQVQGLRGRQHLSARQRKKQVQGMRGRQRGANESTASARCTLGTGMVGFPALPAKRSVTCCSRKVAPLWPHRVWVKLCLFFPRFWSFYARTPRDSSPLFDSRSSRASISNQDTKVKTKFYITWYVTKEYTLPRYVRVQTRTHVTTTPRKPTGTGTGGGKNEETTR
jgi:hypothetical protein